MESLSTEHLKAQFKRIYQGTYHYLHQGINYCEENFEVLKSMKKSFYSLTRKCLVELKG